MSADMDKDIFAEQPYGKLALQRLAPTVENFRLFLVEWQGEKPGDRQIMKVTGAEFREAKAGPHKGKLSIMVKGTSRSVFLTKAEVQATR